MNVRIGILTVSDKGARGLRVDTSGSAIKEMVADIGSVEAYEVVPDEAEIIAERLRRWSDELALDLILTTGGTGLSPRDITPEATLAVVDRLVPGITEAMREEGRRLTPMAMLSRAVAGTRGRTLIVNLPGSERGVRENLATIRPVLLHAIEMLREAVADHTATATGIERVG